MEAQIAACTDIPTVERLEALRTIYESDYKSKKRLLEKKLAEKLLALLLSLAGYRVQEGSPLTKKFPPEALLALELFYYFTVEDEEFQDAVERKEAAFLAAHLKLTAHLDTQDSRHTSIALLLKDLLAKNFPKFTGWETPVVSPSPLLQRFSSNRLPSEGQYYDVEPVRVAQVFRTDIEKGLKEEEIEMRLERYGLNKLPDPPSKSAIKMLLGQLSDFMVLILLTVGIISLAMMDWIEAVVLFLVVISNVLIGFYQEFKAERTLQALKSFSVQAATVLRDGEVRDVEAEQLVPGDVVLLEEGDTIPADLRLFEAINLQVIESLLTGESEPVTKTVEPIRKPHLAIGDRSNTAFMSTSVVKGRGKGIVVSSGLQTEVGKISTDLAKPKTKMTPLQRRLNILGKILVAISVVLCAIIVGIGFLRTYLDRGEVTLDDVEVWIKVGVSLAVSVIPEGLVAVTTVTMALGIQRMAKKNAVVRKLPAVETIGSLTTICSDKTGTLTEGKMKAELLWAANKEFTFTGTGNDPKGSVYLEGKVLDKEKFPESVKKALMVSALCNNATILKDEKSEKWIQTGDPTEVALLLASHRGGVSKEYFIHQLGYTFLNEIPFDSDRKCMSVIYKTPQNSHMILSKGAPETILKICNRILTENSVKEFSKEFYQNIEKQYENMAARGLRVLALAYDNSKPFSKENSLDLFVENDLIFIGLIGLIDPPRVQVKPAIKKCRDAGIRVCMITGDHPKTALAIALQLSIIDHKNEKSVITGVQLDAMTKKDLANKDPFPTIVKVLQMRGEVIGMTGDGVNDAPAIKHADIGIAMGGTATDLTKESADVVLTDDNFYTIVKAVKEGRRTYDNIHKFVLYLLACNSAEIYLMLISVIIGVPVPFTPIMILWANLIADIPPALALGIDPPEEGILERPPRDPKKGIFAISTAVMLLFYGASMSLISLAVYLIAIYVENYEIDDDPGVAGPAKTLAFINLTATQLLHAFLARSQWNTTFTKNFFKNHFLVGGVCVSLVLLVTGAYVPGLNTILNQTPPSALDWAKICISVVLHIIFVELFKMAGRAYKGYTEMYVFAEGNE